jgi:hypothetical protein
MKKEYKEVKKEKYGKKQGIKLELRLRPAPSERTTLVQLRFGGNGRNHPDITTSRIKLAVNCAKSVRRATVGELFLWRGREHEISTKCVHVSKVKRGNRSGQSSELLLLLCVVISVQQEVCC